MARKGGFLLHMKEKFIRNSNAPRAQQIDSLDSKFVYLRLWPVGKYLINEHKGLNCD